MGAGLTRTKKIHPAATTDDKPDICSAPLIDEVPNELVLHVFSLLERFSQIRFRRVCSRWDDLLRSYQPTIVKVDVDVAARVFTISHPVVDRGVWEKLDMNRYYRLIDHQDLLIPLRTKYPCELIVTIPWGVKSFAQCHDVLAKTQRDQLVGVIYDNVNLVIWYPAGCEGDRMCKSRYPVPVVCDHVDLVLPYPNGLLDMLTRTAREHLTRDLVVEQWKKAEDYWTSVSNADVRKLRKILCDGQVLRFKVGLPNHAQLATVKKCTLLKLLYLARKF